MERLRITVLVATFFALFHAVCAQNITASTCANPGDFTACYQEANNGYESCIEERGTDLTDLTICACALAGAEIDCALQSCWNVVGDVCFFPHGNAMKS